MNLNIRPIMMQDASFINEIRRMDGVRENMLGIISERITRTEAFINGLTDNDHVLVAEIEEEGQKKVVGIIGLHINKNLRTRHSASLGIAVHRDYQGKGIGKALFQKILDLADNWLMLVRVELGVFVDNERAINLYKSMGFEIEGRKKYAAIRNGEYVDEYIMARYRLKYWR
ncbi:GNAT family N-acetyltransferase [Fonticella tunisiensis]|uniref:Putative acetyltransferase n=1 Tax=Fonticella tunisiensis TaxID=1096341 RepID=A0A4R7KB04_9CLOT|nr:GNAT family N-acetyltransferase [Fonticella tunisiensis]TDT52073.1 putative acetyltransferase [Fonticella tunisiensis]